MLLKEIDKIESVIWWNDLNIDIIIKIGERLRNILYMVRDVL